MQFDLSTREGRYRARKAGIDVPKRKPGMRPKEFSGLWVDSGGCKIWVGELNRDGYGRYHINGKTFMAHRYAWELVNGPIPQGKLLMHSCDNPACIEVGHLSIGGHIENQADKVAKGRQAKGEKCGSSILTEEQVMEIRKRYSYRKTTYKMLAIEYGVCRDTIRKAVHGIYWRHIA